MKKRKFSLSGEYGKSWHFIRESRRFIYAVTLIFIVSSFIGFFVPLPEAVTSRILEFLREILEKTEGMSYFELTGFILSNNVQSSFIGLIFGVFFGIYPVFAVIMNGFILGFVVSLSVGQEGIFVIWKLLPHGIFELPAIFISFGLGLKIGSFIFCEKRFENLKNYTLNSLRVFLFVIIPLLIIAAIIESGLIILFN